MSEASETFQELMHRVCDGDETAACRLYEMYAQNIAAAVRRRLAPAMRKQFDSEDFVQSVWKSFFATFDDPCRFASPAALAAFLARMASNKVAETGRRSTRKRNDVRRELQMDVAFPFRSAGIPGSDPTPSEVASANEVFENLVRSLKPEHRLIVELRQQGHTLDEIARRLNVHERTVRRVLERTARNVGD